MTAATGVQAEGRTASRAMGRGFPTGPTDGEGPSRGWARAPLAVALVGLALRLWKPGPTVITTDEFAWITRSAAFGRALTSGDLAAATTGPLDATITRPGLPTMWAGFLGDRLADTSLPWVGSQGGLDNGQALVALLCSIGLWFFIVAAVRVVGRRAAIVAGGLLAVEPLLVGHSAVLHTDALVTTFSATSLVAAAAAVRARGAARDRRGWRGPPSRFAALSGAAAAVALLTKINAAALLVPGVPAVVVLPALAAVRRRPDQWRREARAVSAPLAIILLAALVVSLAVWPALWVDPVGNLRSLLVTARMSGDRFPHFFMGSVTVEGDARFYAVVGLLRSSAWLLLLGAVSAGWFIGGRLRGRAREVPRSTSWALAVPAVVYATVITLSDKQYDRYILPLLPFGALLVGTACAQVVDGLPCGWRRRLRLAGWGAGAVAAVWTLSLAPYASTYVDPLAGGQEAAAARIPLGWGQGKEWASDELADLSDDPCPVVSTRGWLIHGCTQDFSWLRGEDPPPDYVVIYIADRQLGHTAPEDRYLERRGELVDELRIDGVTYVEIWDPDPRS